MNFFNKYYNYLVKIYIEKYGQIRGKLISEDEKLKKIFKSKGSKVGEYPFEATL